MPGHRLEDALFAADLPEAGYWEERYPLRHLPASAEVTRFAPSPTGALHLGSIYVAMLAHDIASHSRGTYLVRVEDTDQGRIMPGAIREFGRALSYFGLEPDEAAPEARWGPYRQSEREPIYHSYVRELVRRDLAYPCFCPPSSLAEAAGEQRRSRVPQGYYGKWAACRQLSRDEATERVDTGEPHVIRFRTPHAVPRRIRVTDQIRGPLIMRENSHDVIILKSARDGQRLPTYHFAHVVDDHLMRITLVIRGEEWLPSLPFHLQLHEALGFQPPGYAHIASILKLDNGKRRKLSKRRDPEASVAFYLAEGYPADAVRHYLGGLANSRLAALTTEQAMREPVRLGEAKVSGAIADIVKLRSISKNYIATLPPADVVADVRDWAAEHDRELLRVLRRQPALARRAVDIAHSGSATPRKDIACWSEFRDKYGFCFADLFTPVTSPADARLAGTAPALVNAVCVDFADGYRHYQEPGAWLGQIRLLASKHGFAPSTEAYRLAPDQYGGTVRDVARVIRILLTGRDHSPDLFAIAQALGEQEVLRRVTAVRRQQADAAAGPSASAATWH